MASMPKESLERLVFLRREMDRIFRDFLEDPEAGEDNYSAGVVLDVFETQDSIIIEAELPGIPKENISLSVLRDIVIIEGHKQKLALPEKAQYHCLERTFGKFRSIVEIPAAGDTRLIKAEYGRGILKIRLPKIKERRGQRHKVPIE